MAQQENIPKENVQTIDVKKLSDLELGDLLFQVSQQLRRDEINVQNLKQELDYRKTTLPKKP